MNCKSSAQLLRLPTDSYPCSIQWLDYDEVMDIANREYFDASIRAKRKKGKKAFRLTLLAGAGEIYQEVCYSRSMAERHRATQRAIEQYGRKTMAKRILALLLEDEFQEINLLMHHCRLARTFCKDQDGVDTMISLEGYISVLRKGWETIKGPNGLRGNVPYSPRSCLRILVG